MYLTIKVKNKDLIVSFKGELDHHSSKEAREKIDKYYLDKNLNNIILDLRDLTFMDSSGIGLIMGRYKNTEKNNKKLIVVNDNSYVERILKMAGLLKLIEYFPTVELAVENL